MKIKKMDIRNRHRVVYALKLICSKAKGYASNISFIRALNESIDGNSQASRC